MQVLKLLQPKTYNWRTATLPYTGGDPVHILAETTAILADLLRSFSQ